MKLIFILAMFVFANSLFAQVYPGNILKKDMYVFNNLRDTIRLSRINDCHFCFCDNVKVTDSIQIDGVGSKEIVFLRSCNGFIDDHGGTFDITESIKITKYEIWNLDLKKLIFEAVAFRVSDYNRLNAYKTPPHTKGVESYSYDFKIDSTGQITISNLKTNIKAFRFQWKTIKKKGKEITVVEEIPYDYYFAPDKREGTYKYVKGEYFKY